MRFTKSEKSLIKDFEARLKTELFSEKLVASSDDDAASPGILIRNGAGELVLKASESAKFIACFRELHATERLMKLISRRYDNQLVKKVQSLLLLRSLPWYVLVQLVILTDMKIQQTPDADTVWQFLLDNARIDLVEDPDGANTTSQSTSCLSSQPAAELQGVIDDHDNSSAASTQHTGQFIHGHMTTLSGQKRMHHELSDSRRSENVDLDEHAAKRAR